MRSAERLISDVAFASWGGRLYSLKKYSSLVSNASDFHRASMLSNARVGAQTDLGDRPALSSQRGVKGPFRAITRAITPGQRGVVTVIRGESKEGDAVLR